MREVIQDIREICDARRCCVLLMDDENQDCCVLNDSLRTGEAPPSGESSSKNFYYTARTWEETLAGSTCLLVKDESGLQVVKERNPMWYSSLMRAKILSLVLFPLKHNGKLVGYIWASNFDVKNAVKIKEVLELATFFIASEIANYQLVKRLETLSAMDLLTGTRNRNSMNNRVAEFNTLGKEKPKSLGIVFADLNGLKQINDKKGHVAGDRLLKRAALALQQVFAEDEIYRAGGDEFMVISENTSKESIEEKISELRRIADRDEELSFAIGLCYDDGDINILKAMHAADEGMYQDKEAYYKKYPERKYR